LPGDGSGRRTRGGLNAPDADRPKLRRHLGRYYEKMGEIPPWNK